MEARLTKQKLLGEFLLEQQEPFTIEAFLLGRGCSRSLLNGSFVQRSSRWKRKNGGIQLSKMLLRAIQHQIGFFNGSFKRDEHRSGDERVGKCSQSERFSTSHGQAAVEQQDGPSSPSSTTAYISSNESSSHTEEDPDSQNQDGLEIETQESTQLYYSKDEQGYSKHPVLNQQTKRLRFDCVTGAIGTHKSWKGREKLGLAEEEICKLVCERVIEWSTTTSRSETRITITELVYYDQLLDGEEEQVLGIATGIADGILGDIRDEILADMGTNTELNCKLD